MTYLNRLNRMITDIDTGLVDFSRARTRGHAPTQVSSEFLTNKEQGDWAEKTLLNAINHSSDKYVAVKYGRDDDIVAGEETFKAFYEAYQMELDEIGKRPDVLIFDRKDFKYDTLDISHFSREVLDELVPKAKCGIEVRSSAFQISKYESFMDQKHQQLLSGFLQLKEDILCGCGDLLREKNSDLYETISRLTVENLHTKKFRSPSWKGTPELQELSSHLKQLNQVIAELRKRPFLSITPKVEDLKLVYTWIQKYDVPHFYVQVFFDRAYGISFERILSLLSTPALKNHAYFIESDVKNQNKTTIKIHAEEEKAILEEISIPPHHSEMKELGRGRLLFYVKFCDSTASLNKAAFQDVFGIEL